MLQLGLNRVLGYLLALGFESFDDVNESWPTATFLEAATPVILYPCSRFSFITATLLSSGQ